VKYDLIVVRYGEIALKGKEIRRRFENILINNINNALNFEKIPNKIYKEMGRIFVYTDKIDKSINVLKKIFGIISISPSIKTDSKIESISKLAVKISKENITKTTSFALRVSRTGNHDYSSQDIAIKVGNEIINATNAKVNLTKPNFELFIEIRDKDAYFFVEKIRCTGGMPLNTQGKVLSFVESNNSILAAWYLMRRGCTISFLVFNQLYIEILEKFSKKWYFNLETQFINSKSKNFFEEVNRISNEKNYSAIVTGFKFDQDFSDIKEIKKQCNLPVLHPIIALEDEEIIKRNKEIGL